MQGQAEVVGVSVMCFLLPPAAEKLGEVGLECGVGGTEPRQASSREAAGALPPCGVLRARWCAGCAGILCLLPPLFPPPSPPFLLPFSLSLLPPFLRFLLPIPASPPSSSFSLPPFAPLSPRLPALQQLQVCKYWTNTHNMADARPAPPPGSPPSPSVSAV